MSDLNVITIEGRLVKSAELSHFQDGTAFCNFCIANNETYKDSNGEYQSIPSFFDCAMKGAYAETMSKHLIKGRGLSVVGRLKQQRWEKDGQMHSRVVIKVDEIHLAHNSDANNVQQQNYSNGQNNYQQNGFQNNYQEEQAEAPYIPFGGSTMDAAGLPEDIPF